MGVTIYSYNALFQNMEFVTHRNSFFLSHPCFVSDSGIPFIDEDLSVSKEWCIQSEFDDCGFRRTDSEHKLIYAVKENKQ